MGQTFLSATNSLADKDVCRHIFAKLTHAAHAGGNKAATAEALGIHRATLRKKLRE